MAATKPGHLSKKNLKQYLEARRKKGQTVVTPKASKTGNRSKKSLSARAKPKRSVLARRRVRSRIAAGK